MTDLLAAIGKKQKHQVIQQVQQQQIYTYFVHVDQKIECIVSVIATGLIVLFMVLEGQENGEQAQQSAQQKQFKQNEEHNSLDDFNNDNLGFMLEQEFAGDYYNIDKNAIFQYITSQTGLIQAALYKNQFNTTIFEVDGIEIILFDPKYHDQRAIRLIIELRQMTGKNVWNLTNCTVEVTKFWKQKSQSQNNITDIAVQIKLINTQNQNVGQVIMDISLQGPGFSFSSILHFNDTRASTLGYCLYTSAVVIIQILSVFLLLRKIQRSPNIVNKMSLTTVALCNIVDFYLTMVHIQFIMASSSNTYLLYSFPSICYIILFVALDMKLLFLVWRSHYMRQAVNPQQLRKKLTTFYIKFYVGLFLYLTLSYFFYFDVWMIILQNLIMLPQIVHNVRIGNNPGFEPAYVLGYLGARILIPFYERGCPSNHFMLTPMPGVVITLFILYAVMISILFLQSKLGPRFFIPRIFQRDYYNYNFKIQPSQQTQDWQCNICLQNFFLEPGDINGSLQQSIMKEKTVMRTPCNHLFHRDCLVNWADVKLECPTCRAVLPPL